MPATRNQDGSTPPPPDPPPPTPNGGAWSYSSSSQTWTWVRGGTPDPTLASQWGASALEDIRQDPAGNRNTGSWTPQHGGGWSWTWGTTPDPNLASHYPPGALTDPDKTPNGADTHDMNTPPGPNPDPPTVTDVWNGVGPHVTGDTPVPPDAGNQPQVSSPPAHAAYVVSPGSIRNVEDVILAQIDDSIGSYNDLKAAVGASQSQNVYTADVRGDLIAWQDRALLQIADVIEMGGQYARALNNAAQVYAKADITSFLPQE